jgi:hypothetical protein
VALLIDAQKEAYVYPLCETEKSEGTFNNKYILFHFALKTEYGIYHSRTRSPPNKQYGKEDLVKGDP